MGKSKRVRQKLHISAVSKAKEKDDEKTMMDHDNHDKVSVKKVASVAGSKATTNPFRGAKITTDMLKQNLPDFDARSAITSKTFKGINLKKKDKQRLRHDLWMEKIDAVQAAKKAKKAKIKRQQTPVVGDLSGMAEALPTLELLMKQSSSSVIAREQKKIKGIATEKQRQKKLLSDINLFKQVTLVPAFKADPSAAITEHLRNKLLQEEQMDL